MNPSTHFDLLCLGSGPAGQRAAVQAAKLGKRVLLIEKGKRVGGVCLHSGTIPSKTFREAVSLFIRRSPLGERPVLDDLMGRVCEVVKRETDVIENQLRRNDISLVAGEGFFKDPHTVVVETPRGWETFEADKMLIAVGTRPSVPRGVELDGNVVITSDDVLNLTKLPKSITIVGAGVVGIEYASMLAPLGVSVTLVDKRDLPLEFVDREIVEELMHQMRNLKVTFRLGEGVSSVEIIEGPPRRASILLDSGKKIVSDLVLYSAGRSGNTDRLNLKAAGIEADDRGRIKVNETFQSSAPHIYAAGDVIGYPSLAATSSEQGRLAACHAFGLDSGPMESHFPIGIYSIPEISMVGQTESELTKAKIPYETGIARYREIARGQILGDDSGMFKMIFHRETKQLLGVHAIGTGATELIHIGQAVLGLGGGLNYFLKTVFNYPTLAECYKVAALDASNKMLR
ncbi:MAG: Si-specific NAD(P)(+) transhydrogenase [Planctomycetota bacterium]